MNYLGASSQLQPNFAEVGIESTEIAAYRTDYSKERFDSLKKNSNREFFYHRDGSYIFALPQVVGKERPKEFDTVLINVGDHERVFTKLIELSFKHFFESHGRDVFKKKYSSLSGFVITTEDPFQVGALSLIPKCFFSVHCLAPHNTPVYILTLAKEYKPQFTKSIEELDEEGIDVRGIQHDEGVIHASKQNLKLYLERTNLQSKFDAEYERISHKSNEFDFINQTFNFINSKIDKLAFNNLKISKLTYLSLPNLNFDISKIQKPTQYYFNKSTAKGLTHNAVMQRKPLSYDLFFGKTIKICAFIPKSDAKQCERLIQSLSNNLREIFHVGVVDIKPYYVGDDRREHSKIISAFSNQEFDLAMLFLYKRDKAQDKELSAYNRLKAQLISKQIPSQSILVENARSNNEYTNRNLSLNIYAKIGGTPWAIEKDGSYVNEFIIGVGSTIDENGVRNIGFASVFDHFGSYVVGSCSPLCQIQRYRTTLREYITHLLSEVVEKRNIVVGEKVRLVFHLFKEASQRIELAAIEESLEEFSEYDIEFAILSVSYNHPFKLYKNITDPLDRGGFIKLSEDKSILSMGGAGNVPLQIKLDWRSTYKDLYELSKQVLFFSHLSHRSFMPSKSPVTVIYPHQLAKLTSDLLSINHWDIDSLNGMKDKLWFI